MSAACPTCEGLGYLIEQTYGEADIPAGWVPVQCCDDCATFPDDAAAASAFADGRPVAYWLAPGELTGREALGDYAVELMGASS